MAFAASKRKRITLHRRPPQLLKITSLVDLMTILLCFLLQAYSYTEFRVLPSQDIHLPTSINTKYPVESIQLVVSKSAVLVEGKLVTRVVSVEGDQGEPVYDIEEVDKKNTLLIPKLKAELTRQANIIRNARETTGRSGDFSGTVTIQAHDQIPYRLLVKILFTTGQSEFGDIRFMAYRRD